MTKVVRYESNVPAGYTELNRVAPGFEEHLDRTGKAVALPAGALDELPAYAVEAWEDDPAGPAFRYATLRNSTAILHALTEHELNQLIGWFRWLPEGVQEVVIEDLAMPPWRARSLPKATLERFANTREGHILAKHWGGAADRRIAMVLSRLNGIRDKITPSGIGALHRVIRAMSVRQLVACCIMMSETQ
jgi:hypothetical protein